MAYRYNWGIVLEPAYFSVLLEGVQTTLALAAISTVASLLGGILVAVGRFSQLRALRMAATLVCDLLRSLPGVFLLLFWFMVVPVALPAAMGTALNQWDGYPFLAAAIGLSLNNTPYIADILYSAIATAEKDVIASARMAGVRAWDFWASIILPGAIISTLPALSARFIHNLKNTALAMVISVHDLTWAGQEVESLSFAGIEVTTVCTGIYVVLGAAFSALFFLLRRSARKRFRMLG